MIDPTLLADLGFQQEPELQMGYCPSSWKHPWVGMHVLFGADESQVNLACFIYGRTNVVWGDTVTQRQFLCQFLQRFQEALEERATIRFCGDDWVKEWLDG